MRITFFLILFLSSYATDMFAQDRSTYIYRFGGAELILLSEAQQQANPAILIDAPKEVLERYASDGKIPNAMNAFLLRMNGENYLFDTGLGTKIFDILASVGIAEEEIDHVILTHMHGDHIGGLLKNGNAAFPKADLYINSVEYDYWCGGKNTGAAFDKAISAVTPYKERLVLFDPGEIEEGGESVLPGIYAAAAYGHTPGHTVFLVDAAGEKILIWGDLTHAMAVQMPLPEIAVTYDVDPVGAVASRQIILRYITAKAIPVAGMHVQYPGIGRVETDRQGGYRFVPDNR